MKEQQKLEVEENALKADYSKGTILRPTWVPELMVLNKDNIHNLIVKNPRRLREKQVMSILRALEMDEHFDVPFVINVNSSTNVIDAMHRKEALIRYFENHPNNQV